MNRDLKLVAAAIFAWALGEGLFFYMVSLYLAELGASPALIGLLVALMALAQMVTMIPAGIAADRWGARNVFVGGWVLGLTTTSIMAGATSLNWFALGYVAYGFRRGDTADLDLYRQRPWHAELGSGPDTRL